jgi:predicted house-cleaning noncanonical NTP pyrophosphatase (MazG superfamily)
MGTSESKTGLARMNRYILSLYERIREIENYDASIDFNLRENMIVANIKVYEGLDEDDIDDLIENSLSGYEITDNLIKDIKEEFNEDRLSNIYNHHCESFTEGWKDYLEGNDAMDNVMNKAWEYQKFYDAKKKGDEYVFESKSAEDRYWVEYVNKTWVPEFITFYRRRHNKYKDYVNYAINLAKKEDSSFDMHQVIDNFEVWQYGRSGGWLSVCNKDVLENNEYDYILDLDDIESNPEFNTALRVAGWEAKDKRALMNEMRSFIKEWEDKFNAVSHFVKLIEEEKKNFKDSLLLRLLEEIEMFLQDNNNEPNCSINMMGDAIKTSFGVIVPLNDFVAAYRLLDTLINEAKEDYYPFKVKVGKYTTDWVTKMDDDWTIKAGCHKFSYNQIKKTIETK